MNTNFLVSCRGWAAGYLIPCFTILLRSHQPYIDTAIQQYPFLQAALLGSTGIFSKTSGLGFHHTYNTTIHIISLDKMSNQPLFIPLSIPTREKCHFTLASILYTLAMRQGSLVALSQATSNSCFLRNPHPWYSLVFLLLSLIKTTNCTWNWEVLEGKVGKCGSGYCFVCLPFQAIHERIYPMWRR